MLTTISALVGLALVAGPGEPLPVEDAFAGVTTPEDVHIAVMKATGILNLFGSELNGTGFYVWKMGANGRKRVFLVAAAHTLEMAEGLYLNAPGRKTPAGAKCGAAPNELEIRDSKKRPLWVENKEADIAVLEVTNARATCTAISVTDLATRADVASLKLGDEVFAVAYPLSFASSSENDGKYGVLRVGRVAGYPVVGKVNSASGIFVDASLSQGASGAPLYWIRGPAEGYSKKATRVRPVVLGVLTMGVMAMGDEDYQQPLELGFASLAVYARELIENVK